MRFLTTNSELKATLTGLLKSCKRARWAVAWASSSAPSFKLLMQQQSKLAQLTVGTHFYQTDPEFIAAFIEHSNAKFVLNPSGVFHPKLYYFERGDGRWDCVVGSPNFTQAAFTSNSESAVWISQEDAGDVEAHKEILSALNRYRNLGRSVTPEDLEAYRKVWARQQERLSSLSGTYENPKHSRRAPRSPLDVPIFKESWEQYFNTVKEDTKHTTDGRLAVLEEAARLFREHGRFSDIDDDGRRGIAGFGRTDEFDWLWFGSMQGAGYFKQAVNQNNARLSNALDRIPLTGKVDRADFDAFVELFCSAFEGSGMATATRLLALKRPDYFVCLSSKNRKHLCKAFGIPMNVALGDYWSTVIARILDSNWWNDPEPDDDLERRIWRSRAAFLDVRFYSPD